MKKIFFMKNFKYIAFGFLFVASFAWAQTTEVAANKTQTEKKALPKIYNPQEDAEVKINELLVQAKKENKNIIVQGGGNWCIWCLRFDNFWRTNPELKSIVDENYLYYHLNMSPENENKELFAKYGNPGDQYGYPVFIILDQNGKQIHTQDSAVLEEGSSYNVSKVRDFFNAWKPQS